MVACSQCAGSHADDICLHGNTQPAALGKCAWAIWHLEWPQKQSYSKQVKRLLADHIKQHLSNKVQHLWGQNCDCHAKYQANMTASAGHPLADTQPDLCKRQYNLQCTGIMTSSVHKKGILSAQQDNGEAST